MNKAFQPKYGLWLRMCKRIFGPQKGMLIPNRRFPLTMNSIIFSCWTRTLYLVSRHLEQAKIPYLQLDGNIPLPQRQATLLKFENEDETPVLIMTTGTGAFGYVVCPFSCIGRLIPPQIELDLRKSNLHRRTTMESQRREPGDFSSHPPRARKRGSSYKIYYEKHSGRGKMFD